MGRLPYVASFTVHTGALVTLYLVCAHGGARPARVPTLLCVHDAACESPELVEPVEFDLPEPTELEAIVVEPEAAPVEPRPEEREPVEFDQIDADEPPPTHLPSLRALRLTPMRRPEPAAPAAAPAPPAPAPRHRAVAPPGPARVTPAVKRGELCRPPAYPERARRRGLEGRVLLRVQVDRDGRPGCVEVEESSGHAILDEAAVDAVRGWTFQPAREGDAAVESILHVPIRFQLRR